MLPPPDQMLPTLPEFGKLHFSELLNEARTLHPNISGPEQHVVDRLGDDKVLLARVWAPIELQNPKKGDDRVFTGFVSNNICTPILMVADGASDTQTISGQIVSGGGEAANIAILASLDVLADRIKPGLDPIAVDDIVRLTFNHAVNKLQEKKIESGTTLLIAYPYIHHRQTGNPVALWHYGYIGDGRITLLSPSRKVDGRSLPTSLLSAQKFDTTAAVTAKGISVDPVIGTVRYSDNDIMVMASDGIDGPALQLLNKERLFLHDLIQKENRGDADLSLRVAEGLRKYRFSDDATIGILATTVSASGQ